MPKLLAYIASWDYSTIGILADVGGFISINDSDDFPTGYMPSDMTLIRENNLLVISDAGNAILTYFRVGGAATNLYDRKRVAVALDKPGPLVRKRGMPHLFVLDFHGGRATRVTYADGIFVPSGDAFDTPLDAACVCNDTGRGLVFAVNNSGSVLNVLAVSGDCLSLVATHKVPDVYLPNSITYLRDYIFISGVGGIGCYRFDDAGNQLTHLCTINDERFVAMKIAADRKRDLVYATSCFSVMRMNFIEGEKRFVIQSKVVTDNYGDDELYYDADSRKMFVLRTSINTVSVIDLSLVDEWDGLVATDIRTRFTPTIACF